MWTKFEISKIGELYSKLPDEKLEDVFPSYIIDAIKEEEGRAYFNLRAVYTFYTTGDSQKCVNFFKKSFLRAKTQS